MRDFNKKIQEVWDINKNNFSKIEVELDKTQLRNLQESIFCPGPFYYYVVDFSTRECNYVHNSVSSFFGVTPKQFTFKMVADRIHPDDIPFVAKCEEMVHYFLFDKIKPDDILHYKINFCFRLKNKNNEYKLISHQALTLSVDGANNIANVLNIHTDVSHLMDSTNEKISFIGLNGRPSFFKVDPFKKEFETEKPVFKLTKRELELVQLISSGFSSDEISKELFIATETVHKHRKNILAKLGCKSMPQVIATCVRENMI